MILRKFRWEEQRAFLVYQFLNIKRELTETFASSNDLLAATFRQISIPIQAKSRLGQRISLSKHDAVVGIKISIHLLINSTRASLKSKRDLESVHGLEFFCFRCASVHSPLVLSPEMQKEVSSRTGRWKREAVAAARWHRSFLSSRWFYQVKTFPPR